MQIEIAEPGRMTQSGSSLLRLIQNNNMPILDLLVRESIQNSLDAGNGIDQNVLVKFVKNEFDSDAFCEELELVGNSLKRRFSGNKNEYLAIRDYHTVGLTGVMDYSEVKDENYGNLLKLVYEISKPQDTEGAGGSWGLGKTIYFRVGIGLVVYYSRIQLENGFYQSRLAVTLVEDETSQEALIPAYNNGLKRGIAWWGEKIGENHTKPITDESYINKILRMFGLEPYGDKETGTTVIIPYINPQALLDNNAMEYLDAKEERVHLYWMRSVEEYLKIAVQRWYAPRLNNPQYPNGMYLQVMVNGEGISANQMEPAFQIIQQLYNNAVGKTTAFDVLKDAELFQTDIKIRSVLANTSTSGTVSAARVSRKDLHMNPPDNKKQPYMYYNCDIKGTDTNKSVICFTRRPGMVVSYQNVGYWADGLPESDSDHYIIAIFVLNSKNALQKANGISLEEYVRKSEMADHTDWSDYNIEKFNPRIISKTQKQIISKITARFAGQTKIPDQKKDTGIGRMLGEMFLPPENFGHGASLESGKTARKGKSVANNRNINLIMYSDDTEYHANYMLLHVKVESKKTTKGARIDLEIDSESGTINPTDWEEKLGLEMPFYLERVYNICSNTVLLSGELNINNTIITTNNGDIELKLITTDSESATPYRVMVLCKTPEKINCDMYLKIHTSDKNTRTVFSVDEVYETEGDEQ